MVLLQLPGEHNGQWEPAKRKVDGALVGELTIRYVRTKKLERKTRAAVLVGGMPRVLKEMSQTLNLVAVWPARKTAKYPAVDDQNLRGLLRRLKMPTDDWTIVNIERTEQ
jgi:CBS domain-containing protein